MERIVVAVGEDSKPFYFLDEQGEAAGWVVDVWKLWSEKTGIPVEFVSVSFSETLELVKNGQADAHGGCYFSESRDVYLDYVTPVCEVETHVFHHVSIPPYTDPTDLAAYRLGIIEGDYAIDYLTGLGMARSFAMYPSNMALFDAIEAGEIKVFVKDTAIGLNLLEERGLDQEFLYPVEVPLYSNYFQIAVQQGNTELEEFLRATMDNITHEERAEIAARWMGARDSAWISKATLRWLGIAASGLLLLLLVFIYRNRVLRREVGLRRAKEQFLQASEQRFRAMAEATNDATVMVNAKGELLFWSAAAESMFGYSRSEVLGRDLRSLIIPPDGDDEGKESIPGFNREEQGSVPGGLIECRARRKDGTVFFVEGAMADFELEGDWYAVANIRDITARKQAEEELRLNEARFEALNQLWGMTTASLQEISGFAMESAVRLTGSQMGYVALMNEEHTVLDMHAWSEKAMQECSLSVKPLHFPVARAGLWAEPARQKQAVVTNDYAAENSLKKGYPKGHVDIVRHMSVPILEHGNVVLVAGVANKPNDYNESDVRQLTLLMQGMWGILQRRKTRAELKESEQRFRTLVDDLALVVFEFDLSTRLTYVNRTSLELFGYEQEDVDKGLYVGNVLHPDDGERARQRIAALFAGSEPVQGEEYRGLRRDGTWFPISIFAHVLQRDGRPVGVRGVIIDMTKLKEAEEKLTLAKEMAETASRSKSEFLATVSHEIRTPLTTIRGIADLLLTKRELAEDVEEPLRKLRGAGDRLQTLINEVLDISKIEAGKIELVRENFSLGELVASVLDMFRVRAAEKGLALECRIGPDVPEASWGSPYRIGQIVTNLMDNALKFTETGAITVTVSAWDSGVEVSVADTGLGLAPDKLETIFNPYIQADGLVPRRFGGTGLGLAICKMLAKLMHGEIGVSSEEGRGSTFTLRLPLEPARHGMGRMQDVAEVVELPPLRILLVEDETANLEIAQAFLSDEGHRVTTASNGVEAVQAFEGGEFDVVLMDIQMPEMDGLQATRAIRELEQTRGLDRTPIIALTADAIKERVQEHLKADMDGCEFKPFDFPSLFRTMGQVLAYSHARPGDAGPIDGDFVVAPGPWAAEPGFRESLSEAAGFDAMALLDMDTALAALKPEHWRLGAEAFVQDTPALVQDILATGGNGDMKGLARLAHRLKGSAANLAASRLSVLARALESAGDNGEAERCSELLGYVEPVWQATHKALREEIANLS